MARIGNMSNEKLKARYPEGAFNPHLDNVGIMENYHIQGTSRKNDVVSTGGKIIGRGRGKAKRTTN